MISISRFSTKAALLFLVLASISIEGNADSSFTETEGNIPIVNHGKQISLDGTQMKKTTENVAPCEFERNSLQSQLEILQTNVLALSEEKLNLKSSLDRSDGEKDTLVFELKRTKDDLSKSYLEANTTTMRMQKIEINLKEFKEKVYTCDEKLKNAINEAADGRRLANQLEKTKTELVGTQTNLDNASLQMQKMNNSFMSLEQNFNDTVDELESTKKECVNGDMLLQQNEELELRIKKIQSDLMESESNYNEEHQKLKELQENAKVLQKNKHKEIEELERKVEKLTEDLDEKLTQIRSTQNLNRDLRNDLFASSRNLKQMENDVKLHYCNVTYIKSDTLQFVKERRSDVEQFTKEAHKIIIEYAEVVKDTSKETYNMKIIPFMNQIMKEMKPHFESGRRKISNFYVSELFPHVENAKAKAIQIHNIHSKPILESQVIPMYEEHGAPLVAKCKEVLISIRLSIISALEMFSINAISYFQALKQDELKENKTSKNSHLYDDTISIFETILGKSADVVDSFVYLLRTIFVLRIFKRPLIAVVSTILLFPYRIIFAFFWICTLPLRIFSAPTNKKPAKRVKQTKKKKKSKQN